MAEIIGIGAVSYLQDIKENFTSNQCLSGVSTSEKKKSHCHLNLCIWDHHSRLPLEAKCQTLSRSLSPAEYPIPMSIFFTWPCCLSQHHLTYTISLLKNGFCFSLCSLETCTSSNSPGNLSLIKIPMTVLAYTFGQHLSALGSGWLHHFQMCAGCKTGRLWFLLSYMPPRFCFTKCTYFLGYFIYLKVILPSKRTPFRSIMY